MFKNKLPVRVVPAEKILIAYPKDLHYTWWHKYHSVLPFKVGRSAFVPKGSTYFSRGIEKKAGRDLKISPIKSVLYGKDDPPTCPSLVWTGSGGYACEVQITHATPIFEDAEGDIFTMFRPAFVRSVCYVLFLERILPWKTAEEILLHSLKRDTLEWNIGCGKLFFDRVLGATVSFYKECNPPTEEIQTRVVSTVKSLSRLYRFHPHIQENNLW